MAIEYVDRADLDSEPLSGGQLRSKLEETLKANRQMAEELHSMKVERTLTAGGFSLVRPEDLAGIPLEKVEEKAKEVEQARQEEQARLLRAALERSGFAEPEIERMIEAGAPAPDPDAEAFRAIRNKANVGAPRPTTDPALNTLSGPELIRHHFEQQGKQAARKGRR